MCLTNNKSDWSLAANNGMVCQEHVGNPESESTVEVFSDGHNTNSTIYRRNLGLLGICKLKEGYGKYIYTLCS